MIRRASRKRASVVALDALWSRVVRSRAGWKCEACGAEDRLCGAHIYPKGAYPALRHDPANGLCLCWSCHLGPQGWHKHPLKWATWLHNQRGGHRGAGLITLEIRAQTARRPDKEAIRLALEQELR